MSAGDGEWERVTVRVPAELPELKPSTCRILLDILIELTEVPVLDGPGEGGRHDD